MNDKKIADSAPAGSGEVEELLKKCDSVLNDMRPISPCLTEQMEGYLADIAALLRKLQQGADYVMVPKAELQKALEGINVPKMSPLKQELFKAGTHAVIRAFNGVIDAASQGQEGGKVPGCEDCAHNGRFLCDEHGPKTGEPT